jgi:hypothetical protein
MFGVEKLGLIAYAEVTLIGASVRDVQVKRIADLVNDGNHRHVY